MRYFNSTSRPHFISTPSHHSDIQAAILCAKQEGLQIRVRSGGHDYEDVQVDVNSETAWVQSGAQLGELYYGIAKQSSQLGFPGGICPTVGVGGHLGGGADNVIDATLIDARGRVLDREAMGEDVFWAIRGGGASSFGIVVSWKLKLVRVPDKLTFFNVHKTLEEGANKLIHKWQQFAHDVHEDLFVRTMILGLKRTNTVQASFQSLFLGPIERLIPVMNTTKFKAKSDFVTDPVPEFGLEGMWKLAVEEELSIIILEPLGGRMKEIPESYTPFPHRIGHLYNIQYLVKWEEDNDEEEEKRHIEWMKKLYDYMEAYVSKSPRAAYLNYRDLDIGTNNVDERKTSFMEASVWGKKYFRDNFIKLCKAKTMIDPHNFFSHEQSIPLFH
ncbi:Berberine bridge enzyme-like 23 [Linum perenne]